MQRSILLIISIFIGFGSFAQDTIRLSRTDSEAIFLKENLLLIAERMKVPEAEALVQQAKLWPNPSLTVDQINLWATKGQTGGQEVSPPFWGGFGRNQQIGMELEQLIETAKKRKKEVAVEQVGVEKAQIEFQALLRELKQELRSKMTGLQTLELKKTIFETQLASVRKLNQAYQNQVKQGNVPKNEVARLKALEFEISKELREIASESFELQAVMRQLLKLNLTDVIQITDPLEFDLDKYKLLSPNQLLGEVTRPDLKLVQLEETYYSKVFDLERARRVPDVTLHAQYDRNGNTMLNFFGIGASIDLPLFNRNQGKINHAKINIDKARTLAEHQSLNVNTEIVQAYQNFRNALEFYESIDADYEKSLDELLGVYTQNFMNRNISMLEYLDFVDTHQDSKEIIIEARKDLREGLEKLNYAVGKDL
jgi:cobalt-zinc-cadmium efflux system outer membrane protein